MSNSDALFIVVLFCIMTISNGVFCSLILNLVSEEFRQLREELKKKSTNLLCFVAACLILTGCSSCHTTAPTPDNSLPNLHQVAPGIWRGGQPQGTGWDVLKSIGVSNVVKLNETSECGDGAALNLGMTVTYLPISTGQQLESGPSLALLSNAVAHLTPGTFVHCTHGEDRTGLIVGAYRVWVEGWPKERAYAEMKALGFHPLLKGLYDCWEDKVKP